MIFATGGARSPQICLPVLGGTVQNSLEGEGPQGNGKGPEISRHCVLKAEKHFLPLAMLSTKI